MKRLSLSFALPAAIVLLCLSIAGVMAYLSLNALHMTLLNEAQKKLETTLEQRLSGIGTWFDTQEGNVLEVASSQQAFEAILGISSGWRMFGEGAEVALRDLYVTRNSSNGNKREIMDDAGDGSDYSAAHRRFHSFFTSVRGEFGYYDIFLIDREGNVIYSVYKEDDFASNLVAGPYAESGLGDVYRRAMQAAPGTMVYADFDPYAPSGGKPSAFFAAPVVGMGGRVVGVYAVQVLPDQISRLTNDVSGLGETGGITLVAPDGTRRNAPRFEGGVPVDGVVPTSPLIEAALRGEKGVTADAVDESGNTVAAAYDSIEVPGAVWGAVAEQDLVEVLAPMKALVRKLQIQIGAMAVVAIVLGVLLGRWVSAPLRRLTLAMAGVADRTFASEIPAVRRRDEIGDVARTLGDFRDRLTEADKTAVEVMFKSSAFTGSSVAMLVCNVAGEVIYHNAAALELFEATRDELRSVWPDFEPKALLGAHVSRLHKTHDRVAAALTDPGQLPLRQDVTIGDARFSINATAVQDDAGTYVGTVIEWADVAEARLNAGILGAIRRNQTVVEIGLDGKILEVNEMFHDTYGFERKEVLGQSFEMLLPDGGSGFGETLRKLCAGGHVNETARRQGKNGRVVWVESSINGIADHSGKVFKLIEIASDTTKAQQERIAAQQHREEMEVAQRRVVNALKSGLSGLAAGDLTLDINDAFPGEYEELRSDFNSAVTQLRNVLGLVVETSGNIRNGASEIAQAADDLSRRTESQAATLEETAAALDGLTESVKSAASGATEADRVVRDAREKAEASGLVVVDAVNAMSEIEKSSAQISQIIGVIDDIAFQTNLLALNAGVEAARAGEAGRGFAVVASEVRTLAQRSSEAAKEIKQLISTSSRFVENGVDLVGQAGEALKTIVSSVTEITGLVSEIASSSKEQASGLTEINSGVTMLDQVTQQNAAMVEQSTAASHSLRHEAEGLAELVSRFRLGTGSGRAPRAPAEAPKLKKAVGDDWARSAGAATEDGWESF